MGGEAATLPTFPSLLDFLFGDIFNVLLARFHLITGCCCSTPPARALEHAKLWQFLYRTKAIYSAPHVPWVENPPTS